MERMSRVWALEPAPPIPERRSFAVAFIAQNPGCVSFEFVDPSYRVREVVSADADSEYEGSQLGRDLTLDPLLGKGLQESVPASGTDAIPKSGRREGAPIIVVPVQRDNEFRGFIVVKVDVQKALADVLATVSGLGYSIVVTEDGEKRASTDAPAMIGDNKRICDWREERGRSLPCRNQLELSSFKTQLPDIALALGLIVTRPASCSCLPFLM